MGSGGCASTSQILIGHTKGSLPLSSIDRLVDETVWHTIYSLVDAISEYHQIMMDELNAEKTTFIVDEGVFCYKVMPFGLKNAGAKY